MNLSIVRYLMMAVATLSVSAVGQAHFPWLSVDTSNENQPILFFGEDPTDRTYHLPESLHDYPLMHVDSQGKETPLSMKPVERDDLVGLRSESPIVRTGSLYGTKAYGLFHGAKLIYYTQHLLGPDATKWISNPQNKMRLSTKVVPKPDGITVTVFWNHQPLSDAEVKLFCEEGHEEGSARTDNLGMVSFSDKQVESGFNALRVGHTDDQDQGTFSGETYKTSSHYLTTTFFWNSEAVKPALAAHPIKVRESGFAEMPLELTSFGGAIADHTLYLYGGHTGSAHSYSTAEQSNELWSLDLQKPAEWKKLPSGPRLQGLALVAHDGKLIRIGGFTAMNAEGEEHDLRSQAAVQQFDPTTNAWSDFAALPEPRSSFGAAVLDDHVYVAGGWAMNGGKESQWHKTAYRLNLKSNSPAWELIAEPPFQRRAVSVSAHDNRLYVIGGMTNESGPSTRTDIYDPTTNRWSEGPALIGKPMTGFGNAAYSLGERLYVSAIDGTIQRLSADGTQWELVGNLDPGRFFHCMLPLTDSALILVGGANMSVGKFTALDIIDAN